MIRWSVAVVCVGLFAPGVKGENALRVTGGGLRYWSRTFEMRGIELSNWRRLVTEPKAVQDTFQPWSDRGVNSVSFSLQDPGDDVRFFAPDGGCADEKTAARFTAVTRLVRDHHLASVVSLFSAERRYWLASAEAYRQAAQTAARLLNRKHSVVFIAGDLFGAAPWSADCPYPMSDPAQAIELCRLINQANPEALVGIPARILKKPGSAGSSRPLCYVAATADALAKAAAAIEHGLEPAKAAGGVITVDATRFLRLSDVASDVKEGTRRYLERVERERLAVRAPIHAPKGPPPGDLLTPQEKAAGFVPLFDGRTLEGWTTLLPDWSVWSVENGAIKCAGKNGQWLRTRKRYGSFVLRFEYKISRNGNSGVFVWSPLVGRSSRFGMEMQIRGLRKKKVDDDATGAIYDVLAPREDASNPPGEWNRVDIACRDSKVTVNINGRVVQDFDADEVPKLQGRLRRGVIGLQDHGDEVWFRNIRILELQKEQ